LASPSFALQNYYLVDDKGAEKLMVMAEDSARLDRCGTHTLQQQQQHTVATPAEADM
jgi:hypothetical protein